MRARLARLSLRLSSRRVLLPVALVLGVLHPVLHGTPLDGGALDSLMGWLQSQAVAGHDDD